MRTAAAERLRPKRAWTILSVGHLLSKVEQELWDDTFREEETARSIGATGLTDTTRIGTAAIFEGLTADRARQVLGTLDLPQGPHPGLWQRSARKSRPPEPAADGYIDMGAEVPPPAILQRVSDGLRAMPADEGDAGVAVPLTRNTANPAPFSLQRRTAGASHHTEMTARAALPEYAEHLVQQAGRF